MSDFRYQIITTGEGSTLVAVLDGDIYQTTSAHPNWDEIVSALQGEGGYSEEGIAVLFDLSAALEDKLQQLSERVTLRGNDIYFDEELDTGPLADQIKRFLSEGGDWQALVKFREKLAANPEPHSREQLYSWLKTHNFTITSDGDIVAYKYVSDEGKSTVAAPSNRPVFVNGKPVTGYVPNQVGSVITMPRSQVAHDPKAACSTGLHVGNWGYSGRGNSLEVHVSPTDVVSVPTDSSCGKMRVCRYKVVAQAERPFESPVRPDDGPNYDYDPDEDYCDECGDYTGGDECEECAYAGEESSWFRV